MVAAVLRKLDLTEALRAEAERWLAPSPVTVTTELVLGARGEVLFNEDGSARKIRTEHRRYEVGTDS